MGIAYRLLGSVSDAQDAVQDTYVKWLSYTGPEIEAPAAWLSRVCTNRCLDQLKSATSKRIDYVGQWIPEQMQTEFDTSPEEQMEIASSLTTAFLMLLERLTPKERAAYLLHDIFAMPFDEVAKVLELQPANCRKLATRAREYIVRNNVRHIPQKQRQRDLLNAFHNALQSGDTAELGKMLRDDADLRADSGGKVVAVRDVLTGHSTICAFIADVLSSSWSSMRISSRMINGLLGLIVEDNSQMHAAVSFAYDDTGTVSHIYIMRHPEKLARLAGTKGMASASGSLTLT